MTSVLIFALLFAQQAAPPEKCRLSGTVTDSITGLPLGKVTVVAEHVDGNRPGASTTTDAEGKFLMVNVDPGQYRLLGRRNSYLDTYYGARRASASGSSITVAAGQKMENLQIKLAPFGVIAGIVRDSDGEPLSGVPVTVFRCCVLFRPALAGGLQSSIFQVATTTTNDLGEYRAANLSPGKYRVSASPEGGAMPEGGLQESLDHSAKQNDRPQVPVTTFYPGTMDPSAAESVVVGVGSRVAADIAIMRSRLYRIHLRLDAPPGLQATARLLRSIDGIGDAGRSGEPDSTGNVEISDVPSGTYRLYVEASEPTKALGASSETMTRRKSCGTSVPVSIGQQDLENLRIVVSGCAEITGRVTTESLKPLALGDARVDFDDGATNAEVKPDGSFTTTPAPGHHTIDLSRITMQTGLYVKSIRAANQDVLRGGFAVAGSEHLELEVVLGSDGGRIEGIVSDADDKPVAGAAVVLIPNDAALRWRFDYTKDVTTDQSGHFEIKNAAPGKYKLFAFDDIESRAWYDPDVLKDYESRGQTITIDTKGPDGQSSPGQTVNLRVIQ